MQKRIKNRSTARKKLSQKKSTLIKGNFKDGWKIFRCIRNVEDVLGTWRKRSATGSSLSNRKNYFEDFAQDVSEVLKSATSGYGLRWNSFVEHKLPEDTTNRNTNLRINGFALFANVGEFLLSEKQTKRASAHLKNCISTRIFSVMLSTLRRRVEETWTFKDE